MQLRAVAVYEYEPLPGINYIRRVKLHPGTVDEAIVISLDVVPFSEGQRPEYEALSYVWGSAEQPEIIRVDAKYGLAISATRNLVTAMKYLRRTDEPRILWVDALCINQADDFEKGPQVRMMGDIFRHATRVVAWLGPEADNSDLIMAKMEYLGSQIQMDYAGTTSIGLSEGATELDLGNPRGGVYLWLEEIDALVHLLLRPWFTRLWIRQEIHLSSPVAVMTCGHSQVAWPVFLRAFVLFYERELRVIEPRDGITEALALYRANLVNVRLSDILLALSGLPNVGYEEIGLRDLRQCFDITDCYDPRDRIYGVLSLTPDYLREAIVPDYTKPFGDVYKDTFLCHLRRTRDLSLLGSCELGIESPIPSWVPNWSRKFKCRKFTRGQFASSQIASWYELNANDVLRVAGVLVGTIQHHDEFRWQLGWGSREVYEELRRLLINMVFPEKTFTDDEKLEYISRSLVCNEFPDYYEPPTGELHTVESGKSLVQKMLSDVDQFNLNYFTAEEIHYLNAVSCMMGRQVFKTTDGQLAIGPFQAQPGDHICVLLGCDGPMVLRSTRDGKFLVVGFCDMQKVSDGDSLLGPLPGHMRRALCRELGTSIWKDSRTGLSTFMDPRLESLNIVTDSHPEFRGIRKFPVHPEVLRRETGVDIRYFDLV